MSRPTNAEARAAEIRANRRWKPGKNDSDLKLALDESKLDREEHQYRWVNDLPGRVQRLTTRDWDVVKDEVKEDTNSLGTLNSVNGGVGAEGKPYNMVLMRKHKVLFEDDQARKMERVEKMDKAILRGATQHAGNQGVDRSFYTPEATPDNPAGVNRIESRSTR